ncbi:MAG: hypothetical protein WA673_04410, partial [Candidatus Acidiferrales bacterium]
MSQRAAICSAAASIGASGIIRSNAQPLRFLLLPIFLTASVTAVNAQDAKPKCPPPARLDDVKETIHGTVVSDP